MVARASLYVSIEPQKKEFSVQDSESFLRAVPAESLAFSLEGAPIDELRRDRETTTLRSCEGIVRDVTAGGLFLEGRQGYIVRHSLPAEVDLRPLLGRRARITLNEQGSPFAPTARTFRVASDGGGLLLLAHDGRLRPQVHVMGGTSVSVALSLRRSGPLVIGTKAGMGALAVGERARIEAENQAFVVMFLAHTRPDAGAYVLADTALLGSGAN